MRFGSLDLLILEDRTALLHIFKEGSLFPLVVVGGPGVKTVSFGQRGVVV